MVGWLFSAPLTPLMAHFTGSKYHGANECHPRLINSFLNLSFVLRQHDFLVQNTGQWRCLWFRKWLHYNATRWIPVWCLRIKKPGFQTKRLKIACFAAIPSLLLGENTTAGFAEMCSVMRAHSFACGCHTWKGISLIVLVVFLNYWSFDDFWRRAFPSTSQEVRACDTCFQQFAPRHQRNSVDFKVRDLSAPRVLLFPRIFYRELIFILFWRSGVHPVEESQGRTLVITFLSPSLRFSHQLFFSC